MPYLSAFARFRDQVRQSARDLKGWSHHISSCNAVVCGFRAEAVLCVISFLVSLDYKDTRKFFFALDIKMDIRICLGGVPFTCKQLHYKYKPNNK